MVDGVIAGRRRRGARAALLDEAQDDARQGGRPRPSRRRHREAPGGSRRGCHCRRRPRKKPLRADRPRSGPPAPASRGGGPHRVQAAGAWRRPTATSDAGSRLPSAQDWSKPGEPLRAIGRLRRFPRSCRTLPSILRGRHCPAALARRQISRHLCRDAAGGESCHLQDYPSKKSNATNRR